MHPSTRRIQFCVVCSQHPIMQCKTPTATSLMLETLADILLEALKETCRVLQENLLEAERKQTIHTPWKAIIHNVADRVWLSAKHFHTTRPLKKLDYKHAELYIVSKTISRKTYKLDFAKTMCNHNVLHVSLQDH
jgi:hypothetical protein